ncbi:MAG: adenylate/guanylate cyclase domain-containing protein [Ferruginibacter sp.]|nr:adenylate/guanylate cyclase domain-containing protein [Ferruginibacter sp.]
MISPEIKNNISRIIPFGIIWLIFSIVYSLLERGLLGDLNNYPSTGNPYSFSRTIFITATTALITGLIIGTIEILYLNKLFLQQGFVKKIVYKTTIYCAVIISFLLINTLIYNSIELKTDVFNQLAWNNVWAFFSSYAFWSVEVYIAAIIGISLFYTEVSGNLGQGVLNNFFTGKYHTPVEEERIFMFLDMKSSTAIAEKLGHIKYFSMLRDYYSDLSNPIIKYSGEIYQYVGDEIVVSWKLKNGLENNNCIHCFFAMKAAIKKQSKKYIDEFGLLPEFKAGFHFGKVTTGEIGVIKKDIIFTGDVLNTTARVQGLCNTYKADILISDCLMNKLHLSSQFKIKALGENELKGRNEKINLFTIMPF